MPKRSDEFLGIQNLTKSYGTGEAKVMVLKGISTQVSRGEIMNAMLRIAIPISVILIYLLTKMVIDRSARSISYMKVFGYHDSEIDRLYLRPVTWTVVGSYVLSLPIVIWLTREMLRIYLMSHSGNIELSLAPSVMVEMLALGIATYLVVAAIHVLRIRRVPLALAMKAQE